MEPTEEIIKRIKSYRKALDETLQQVKSDAHNSREKALAITKIQEATMWLGLTLKELNDGQSCYVHGYDPTSPAVDPAADGLNH